MSNTPEAAPAQPDRSRLVVLYEEPLNAETRLTSQVGTITPNAAHYVRSHMRGLPQLAAADWRLHVDGAVTHALMLTYADLHALPECSLLVTLECAGNGRAFLPGQPPGEPWQYGAVSTAEWTGVPLGAMLERAGLKADVQEIIIEGADSGEHPENKQTITYTRSLPREVALHPDTLLAFAMNGEPLPQAHGFPARLIVPGWYGMAAVKWVTRLHASTQPFRGFFQTERYILIEEPSSTNHPPLTHMRPRSLMLAPVESAHLPRGQHWLRGVAWSGAAPVAQVEVSVDGGASWQRAAWTSAPLPYAWRTWQFSWEASTPGPATLCSRATDETGATQPLTPAWNQLGYVNNAIQRMSVVIV
jgi:DMSO/TMAO reductase YedYZ molybdopterin-dependent catalytic subunit